MENQIPKKDMMKAIHKEVEVIKKEQGENPFIEKEEPRPKITAEGITTYIERWASRGLTPEVILSIKNAANNSDFTVAELKDWVKERIKDNKEKELKDNKEKVIDEQPEDLRTKVYRLLLEKKKSKATEEVVEYLKQTNYIYTTKDDIKPEVWIYKDGVYVPQGKSELEKKIRNFLGNVFNINISNEILHKIKADTQIEMETFFKTTYLNEIPVNNGILDIFTRELKPFNPSKIFFNKLPVKYDPEAKCPNIIKFLSEVVKDKDDINLLLELFGFALLKEYRFEKAFMFVGSGRNGKSKTIELFKRLIGIDNCCSVPLSMITADSTSVCELFGKMVNLAGDLNNDSLKKTGMFKQTVGRDLIAAKRKYLRDLPFVNYAKHIFACNELPRVYDLTDGFWTKWILIEFPYKFITKKEYNLLDEEERKNNKILDPEILDKITTPIEMSGLLNKILDSLNNLITKKDFGYSQSTKDIQTFWVRQSDSFLSYCMDYIKEEYNGRITKKELRKEYNKYCKKNKLKGCSDRSIKATLQDRYGAVEGQDWETKLRYWDGIKLKENIK